MARQHIRIPADEFEAIFWRRVTSCRNEGDIERLHTTVIKNVSVLERSVYLNEIDRMHARIMCSVNDPDQT